MVHAPRHGFPPHCGWGIVRDRAGRRVCRAATGFGEKITMDIVKLATQRATPQLLSQVVGLAGAHPDQVQKGLGAAVSAIMAGILGACRKPEAATAFGTALSRAGGLNDLLAKDPALAASTGWEALAPLLGAGAARPLSAALAGHAGLPKAAAGKLLGLAAAMVLGTLGNEAADKGLDAAGTLGLMQGQKDAITGALPIDLARALGTLDLLDGVSAPQPARPAIDLMQPSAAAAAVAPRRTGEMGGRPDPARGSGLVRPAALRPGAGGGDRAGHHGGHPAQVGRPAGGQRHRRRRRCRGGARFDHHRPSARSPTPIPPRSRCRSWWSPATG